MSLRCQAQLLYSPCHLNVIALVLSPSVSPALLPEPVPTTRDSADVWTEQQVNDLGKPLILMVFVIFRPTKRFVLTKNPFSSHKETLTHLEYMMLLGGVPNPYHCYLETPHRLPHQIYNVIWLSPSPLHRFPCFLPVLHVLERGCTRGQWHNAFHGSLPTHHGGFPHQS